MNPAHASFQRRSYFWYRWILLAGLAFCACSVGHAKTFNTPEVSLSDAITIATTHLHGEKIDLSNHYLSSVRWLGVHEEIKQPYWHLEWRLRAYMAIGGEVFVYVNQDGIARHAFGE